MGIKLEAVKVQCDYEVEETVKLCTIEEVKVGLLYLTSNARMMGCQRVSLRQKQLLWIEE